MGNHDEHLYWSCQGSSVITTAGENLSIWYLYKYFKLNFNYVPQKKNIFSCISTTCTVTQHKLSLSVITNALKTLLEMCMQNFLKPASNRRCLELSLGMGGFLFFIKLNISEGVGEEFLLNMSCSMRESKPENWGVMGPSEAGSSLGVWV